MPARATPVRSTAARAHSLPALLALAALLLAACSGGDTAVDPLPPPPSTQARPATTAPPDFTGVALPGVAAGRVTTTTVVVGPGKANINGTVIAPDGTPAASATVHIERLVGQAVATMDVAAGPDGTWSAPGVLGGSYRVRAWRPPDSAQTVPAFFFVGATETVPVELKLERNFGTTPLPAVAPKTPVVGQTTNLVLQVSSRSVDGAGIVQGVPMANATVALDGGGGWTVSFPNPAVADGTGRARWELICRGAGVQPMRLVVNGAEQFQLALPACTDAPTPPPSTVPLTTTPGAPTTRPATTTTRPGATTRPPTTAPTTTTTRKK